MEKIRLVVVDGSKEVANSIKKYFEVHSNISIVANFEDGETALEFMVNNHNSFDVVITDLILPKVDGMCLINNMKKRKFDKKVIVLSSLYNEEMVKKVSDLGVDYYMIKPFSFESLEERILDLFKNSILKSNKDVSIEIEVSSLLHNLGIPSHIRGYQYIRDGVMLIFNRNSYVSYITKEVYPEIADKYNTTSSRVERAIRHAIEISWDRGDLTLMENLFGHSIDYDRSKPTNSEYINTLADRMKLLNKSIAA